MARRGFAVHALNAPVFAAALVTGVLLFSPTLRAMLLSGYSEDIRGLHRWFGRGEVVLALAIAALWLYSGSRGSRNDANALRRAWRVVHVSLVSAAAVGFAATGIVVSSPSSYSLSIVDYSLAAHLWLTYMSCAVVMFHAFIVLRSPHRRELRIPSMQIGNYKVTGNSSDAG